jgi:glycosyltransferase involved in cell wall biosynthesis
MQIPDFTSGDPPRITAIVPARNEEAAIETCVRSVAGQPEITQMVVVNDGSIDRTGEILARLAGEIPRLEILTMDGPPAGWLGKNWAAWQGAQRASGHWLLFTDADAELMPGAAARALRMAGQHRAALVSFSPEQVTESWYEQALIPFVYCRLAEHFSCEGLSDPGSAEAAANGQFLMIRADAYQAIGGHKAVKSDVLEDVALAKRVKGVGCRVWFGSGAGVVRVRMYRSFSAMWEGWRKNLYLLVGGSRDGVARELRRVVPWIALVLVVIGAKIPAALAVGLGLLVGRHAAYGAELIRNHFRGIYILYYIPAVVLYGTVLWSSYKAHERGHVEWKGRQVAVGASTAGGDVARSRVN